MSSTARVRELRIPSPETRESTAPERQSGIRLRTLRDEEAESIPPTEPDLIVFESLLWTPSVKPPPR